MRVLIVPDSFKGTLHATEAAAAIAEGVRQVYPEAQCELFPMADGGEGSSELAGTLLGAKKIQYPVVGPEGQTVEGFYFRSEDAPAKNTALIELAAASGFSLSLNPTETGYFATTYGTGQLIHHAVANGARAIRLFLGGSATSDAGVGIARALGAVFYDAHGSPLPADSHKEDLSLIADIDFSALDTLLSEVEVLAAVDVENPLFGPHGAAYTYGPQKGLSPEQCKQRNHEHQRLAEIVARVRGSDFAQLPGAGAAGGAGFAVCAYLGGRLVPGAAFFLDSIDFNSRAKHADVIISGEGRVDSQSIQGKLLGEIAERTKELPARVLCLSGLLELEEIPEELSHICFFNIQAQDALEQPYLRLKELSATSLRNLPA